ncbi:NAD(P)H:quinone oxidoreductase, type IV [Kwoniella heveanensis CBS 569]|uniref:NAD(P)H:quinone oxidoreductase, type IV n=1 Tax=Kwoniella heveanensis BCC8398 TaxID=1296120 RepID=A0A1B9H045_9TREE|nr:NAD(P)H:quinone oxidoreductase, type IV [Kwoniella heveanensis BCC8398]OCF45375.1 NAD(P)H:quinone oxidoreductase, type IV [Kwoniella heveanensis CBS 569]
MERVEKDKEAEEDAKKIQSTKPVIAVAFYSTYGHIGALAEEVIKGVEASGAIVKPYVIKETLPEEVLTKMHAGSSLHPKYPVITPNDLAEVDGLILGAPTRYGRVPAQVDAFFDATGGLWAKGGLVGKFVTMFTSTAGQHSGQESTFLTTYPFFAHLVYVPIGYANQAVGSLEQVQGGSPYGASTIAGADGSRKPLALELEIAQFQGKFFADFVTTFTKGKHAAVAPAAAAAATNASSSASATPVVPAAAKEVPTLAAPVAVGHDSTTASKEAGYTVDSAPTTSDATATATPAPEEQVTEKPATTAAAPVAAEKATPAPAATKASTPVPAPAKKEAPKKKKGFFASCCGDSGIDK